MSTQLSREHPAVLDSLQSNGAAVSIALAGCFSGLLHFLNKAAIHSPSFLVTPYWISFYELSYADGYRRRALLGSLLREAEPHGGSAVAINIFAALVLAALLVLYIASFSRQMRKTAAAYVFTFAFFISALASIFFEVMGDLLQPALLLFLVGGWFIATRIRGQQLKIGLAVLLLVPCFLIHEASIFFIAPCFPFLLHRRPRFRHFFLTLATLAVFMGWSTIWGRVNPHLTYQLHLLHGATRLETKETLGTPSFGQLLHDLYGVHFAGIRGKINLLIKVCKIGALIFGGWIASAIIFKRRSLTSHLYLYLALMIFSIPFWIIAADWGRFTTYCFLLSITICSWPLSGDGLPDDDPVWLGALADRLEWLSSFTLVRVAALFALVQSPFFASRIYGMDLRSLLCVVFIGLLAMAQVAGWIGDPLASTRRERGQAAEEASPNSSLAHT